MVSSLEALLMVMFSFCVTILMTIKKTPHFITCVKLVIQKASGWFWNNYTILGDETNL